HAQLEKLAKKGDPDTQARQPAEEDLAEGNRLWEEGKKPAAVEKYRLVLGRVGKFSVPGSKLPTVYQRVIEGEFEQGKTSSATSYINKALFGGIPLSFVNPKAQEFFERTKQEKGTDSPTTQPNDKKEGSKKQSAGKKLAALQAVAKKRKRPQGRLRASWTG